MNTIFSPARVSSFALAAMLTLAMLMGVNTLASLDGAAPQMVQAATSQA